MENSNIALSKYSGLGTSNIEVTTEPNEGLDEIIPIRVIVNDTVYDDVTIIREGRREIFNGSDGEFLSIDGDTLNVIKNGYE